MSADDYTPSANEVREAWVDHETASTDEGASYPDLSPEEAEAQFDRMLAAAIRQASQPVTATKTVHVVIDGPPEHLAGRFVEVETPYGEGVRIGQWIERPDGYWALALDVPVEGEASQPVTDEQVERVAVAIAKWQYADYWADEISEWESSEDWRREAYPEDYPATAYEDREHFRAVARAALEAAREAGR